MRYSAKDLWLSILMLIGFLIGVVETIRGRENSALCYFAMALILLVDWRLERLEKIIANEDLDD